MYRVKKLLHITYAYFEEKMCRCVAFFNGLRWQSNVCACTILDQPKQLSRLYSRDATYSYDEGMQLERGKKIRNEKIAEAAAGIHKRR